VMEQHFEATKLFHSSHMLSTSYLVAIRYLPNFSSITIARRLATSSRPWATDGIDTRTQSPTFKERGSMPLHLVTILSAWSF
ncbi:Hypothetical protein CINCED_3A007558, partial [Cinara cedri]